jgi:hypothetical protein
MLVLCTNSSISDRSLVIQELNMLIAATADCIIRSRRVGICIINIFSRVSFSHVVIMYKTHTL